MVLKMFNHWLPILISLSQFLECTSQAAFQVADLILTTTPVSEPSLVSLSTIVPSVSSPSSVASELSGGLSNAITPAEAQQAAVLFAATPSPSPMEAFAPNILRKSRREISRESEDIIEGILESYLHEQRLAPGEKYCLRRLVGKVAADVMSAGDDVVKAIKEMTVKGHDNMDIMAEVADVGIQATSIVRLAKQLLKDCVKGDVLETLNTSAKHLMNMSYVGNRLLANGVDIAEALAESVMDWDRGDHRGVGEHIGEALRKILLADASDSPPLPEGMPRSEIIAEVTSGLMNGFFVEGSELTMKDLAAPNVDIEIDLHECIANNEIFFQNVFKGAWTIIAQMSANPQQFGHMFDFLQGKPNGGRLLEATIQDGMSELAMAMMSIPAALKRCNIDDETRDMLSDAVKSLQWARFKFDFPREKFNEKEVQDLLARAVQSWTRWRFEDFGDDVGQLLRAMVLLVYPQKYEVDKVGHLRRTLIAEAHAYQAKQQTIVPPTVTFVLSCATAIMAGVFLAARAFQSGAWRRYDSLSRPSRRDISRFEEPSGTSQSPARAALAINADMGLLEA